MSQVSSILDLVKRVKRVKCVNVKRKSIALKTRVNVFKCNSSNVNRVNVL